tara:strand:- start:16905 stop:17633 length:729 start_codon:yes stop_codon:yes gene_type:complete
MSFNNSHKVSGERLTLGQSSKRNQEDHIARYDYATKFTKGNRVLDVACGTGYGVSLICESGALEVVGVDIDSDSISYAQKKYNHKNAKYICSSASKIPMPDEYFDAIVTFETIEHLEEEDRELYLRELRRVLKDDGVVILSTPNKLITSPWSKIPLNPYHILEYYEETLRDEIEKYNFRILSWCGQRRVKNIFTKYPIYVLIRIFEKISRKNLGIYDIADSSEVKPIERGCHPRYFVLKIKK